MNYTGFGADPARIYSFNPYSYGSAIERMVAPHRAMAGLRSWIGYRQAGREGRQRMETLVDMGLPPTTDISRVRYEGRDYGGRPIFSAPRPQPFGTYGSIGMDREEKKPTPPMVSGGGNPQPTQQPAQEAAPQSTKPQPERTPSPTGYIQSQYGTSFSRTPLGFTGEPASFTVGGGRFGMKPQPTATSTPTPFPELNTRNYLFSTMGGIRFPFAGY